MDFFHPAVRRWFEGRFPDGPSAPQAAGWPAIARGENTLISAPTGSGKTLAAFLVCISSLLQGGQLEAGQRSGASERSGDRQGRSGRPRGVSGGGTSDEPFQLDPLPPPRRTTRSRSRAGPAAGDGGPRGERPPGVEVLYVSPLKALAADIQKNLETPLVEIETIARSMGHAVPEIRVGMRSGDTPASVRAAMLKKPPQILVTTPESLYLLLTSARGREILRPVRTVIVDEIHAMARDKRGSHLALSLERLEMLCDESPTRIGLSATQKPIELVAKLLVGVGPDRVDAQGEPRCTIVDEGHRRELDLATVLPSSELEAVASGEQMGEILDSIAAQVEHHKTTLVFVNTRRMAERLAHQLAERLGEEGVAAHHGSLSRSRRLRVETALREGRLRALVATASLELGIDVGPVELVCQIGSPRSLATFLQRVGRSGHFRGGTPKGRLYPMTRDELVECAGLLRGVREGRLDRLLPPVAPLDILAQQIVAACAAEPWKEEELFELCSRAAPYENLDRETFDEVVRFVSEGIETGRGRRAAYVHHDRIGGMLRARRGARLAALTSGGAIPDVADYRVVADPDETHIGSVGEDFAIDSLPGDVFLLGSHTWRIRRVESGKLRVVDAEGATPNIPFWAGEAPARTEELSQEVSALRAALEPILATGDEAGAIAWLESEAGVARDAGCQIARYLGVSRSALGGLPTRERLVLERFFDDAGGMQLVIHSPRGGRINRALCLALRKKFCKSFNFELQAAANDDAMVLSLGPHHSFPLEDVPLFLSIQGIEDTLRQAVLPTPLFTARWRWNLNRALTVLRFRSGKRNPPPIQRMESDDLMAAIFPQAAACQENVAGPIEIPDHVLVRQTMHDCLTDAMDAEGLKSLIHALREGSVETLCVDTTEPSPLSHEILNGKPFTYLDDAPLEERRTRAVKMRRGLPVEERDLTQLDPDAIARVRDEARPAPRDREELHDLLLGTGFWRANPDWLAFFRELEATGRAFAFEVGSEVGSEVGGEAAGMRRERGWYWAATERVAWVRALHPEDSAGACVMSEVVDACHEDEAIAHVLRGHLETSGPVDALQLATTLSIRTGLVEIGLARLEAEGFVLRGAFCEADETAGDALRDGEAGLVQAMSGGASRGHPAAPVQFCARRLLARIHADSQARLRARVEPISAQDFMRFLFEWQHATPSSAWPGAAGVGRVIEQLQGFDIAAGAWESEILPARVRDYRPEWLDPHCLSGQVSWLRVAPPVTPPSTPPVVPPSTPPITPPSAPPCAREARMVREDRPLEREAAQEAQRARALGRARSTSRSTPLSLVLRADRSWLLQAHRREETTSGSVDPDSLAGRILTTLEQEGALFAGELTARLDARPVEIESALWDLVARGRVGADGFQALRSLLASRVGRSKGRAELRARRGLRRGLAAGRLAGAEGRWSRVPAREPVEEVDRLAEALAEQLLVRWGVVFRDIVARESLALPWREIIWALRRLEARGQIRGGRFVAGVTGEQFALPEALEQLGHVCKRPRTGERVEVCGSDPLNLVGIVVPGERIPARRGRRVVYVDGLPIDRMTLESAEIARSQPTDPGGVGGDPRRIGELEIG